MKDIITLKQLYSYELFAIVVLENRVDLYWQTNVWYSWSKNMGV
ncbi:hypothetical protein SAMN05661091_2919 [Paenibacillus uliginis N3/975]|uniref:Uncharacterized protein n=1 Tax=Paenibacillus uliginis N3/975 TaxID=1313296 RepID=A0A1X7HGF8_9BACL|nr:hypothetical protein [Paenibacillus uliginis]SMF85203.1 hypothetical protein SAMN05661091_2919 [Paenibacillus uliginis N3/975]